MPHPLEELKSIIANQKSIRTSRLEKFVEKMEYVHIQQGKTIRHQKKTIQKLSDRINQIR